MRSFLIEGEAVACDSDGMPVFDRLRYRRADGSMFLFPSILSSLDGRDLRRERLELRAREAVAQFNAGLQHLKHDDDAIACKLGLEGSFRAARLALSLGLPKL